MKNLSKGFCQSVTPLLAGGPFWYSCRGAHNLKLRHWAELPLVNEACIAVKLYDMMDIFVVTSISSFHFFVINTKNRTTMSLFLFVRLLRFTPVLMHNL